MSTLGERIAEARKGIGWTAKELAQRIHLSPQTVHMYEEDVRPPVSSVLTEIASQCGVSREWLADGVGEKYASKKVFRSVDDERILSRLTPKEKETIVRFLELGQFDRRNIRNMVNRNIDRIESRHKEEGN